jgi:hypothetical protein
MTGDGVDAVGAPDTRMLGVIDELRSPEADAVVGEDAIAIFILL